MLNKVLDLIAGAFLAGLISLGVLFYNGHFDEEAFSKVNVAQFEQIDNRIRVVVHFKKHDECELQVFKVLGNTVGIWDELTYTNVGVDPGDRLAGWQTLNGWIELPDVVPELVEIRTRHLCTSVDNEGVVTEKRIDSIFLKEAL